MPPVVTVSVVGRRLRLAARRGPGHRARRPRRKDGCCSDASSDTSEGTKREHAEALQTAGSTSSAALEATLAVSQLTMRLDALSDRNAMLEQRLLSREQSATDSSASETSNATNATYTTTIPSTISSKYTSNAASTKPPMA